MVTIGGREGREEGFGCATLQSDVYGKGTLSTR